jgi:GNAT superfamily N-acetyltransferase
MTVLVRRAVPGDAAALARMRAVMLQGMDKATGQEDGAWLAAAEKWYAHRLPADDFAAFVVDDPDLGVVSSAVGACEQHAPEPANLTGLHGHVSNISTDHRRRRRGHARACLEALLAWFHDETEIRVINLNATEHGAGLYRALGFAAPRYPALQLIIDRVPEA